MTTPTTPDGSAEEPDATAAEGPTEQHPSLPTTDAAQTPPTGPPPPAGPPPMHPPYSPYQPYGAGPFAPRVREPWFNPVKRGAITAAAIARPGVGHPPGGFRPGHLPRTGSLLSSTPSPTPSTSHS